MNRKARQESFHLAFEYSKDRAHQSIYSNGIRIKSKYIFSNEMIFPKHKFSNMKMIFFRFYLLFIIRFIIQNLISPIQTTWECILFFVFFFHYLLNFEYNIDENENHENAWNRSRNEIAGAHYLFMRVMVNLLSCVYAYSILKFYIQCSTNQWFF